MINSKLYVITDPALVQSAFRNKHLSFEPFMVEFSQRMLGVSDETMRPIKNIPADEKAPSFLREFVREIHTAMMGEHLNKMNASALNQVASTLNSLEIIKPESLYLWLRQMLTLATCNALLGNHSPFIDNPGLVDELWYVPIFLGSLPTNNGTGISTQALSNYSLTSTPLSQPPKPTKPAPPSNSPSLTTTPPSTMRDRKSHKWSEVEQRRTADTIFPPLTSENSRSRC
jgi:hypothetical protein